MKSQEQKILQHLKSGNPITPMDALKLFDCFRLGARIYNLKKKGYRINTHTLTTKSGKRVALYRLAGRK